MQPIFVLLALLKRNKNEFPLTEEEERILEEEDLEAFNRLREVTEFKCTDSERYN